MSLLGEAGSLILGTLYEQRVPVAIASAVALVALVLVARRRGWARVARRHPLASASAALAVLAIGGPIGWYLVSPVFIRTELQEPPPVVAVLPEAPVTPPPPRPSASPLAPGSPAGPVASLVAPTPTPWTAAAPRRGTFSGSDDFHFARGTATLIETAPGAWTVRLEDFAVRNGPDLYVYLSPDPDGYAAGAIEVGRLKATDGSFNTPVPAGTDTSIARSVLIWCKQFSHLFAVAPLGR